MTLARHPPDLGAGFRNADRHIGYQVGNAGRYRAFGDDQLHLDDIDLTIGLASGQGLRRAKPEPDKVSEMFDLSDMGHEDFGNGDGLGYRPSYCRTHTSLRRGYAANKCRAAPESLHRQPAIVPSGFALNLRVVVSLYPTHPARGQIEPAQAAE